MKFNIPKKIIIFIIFLLTISSVLLIRAEVLQNKEKKVINKNEENNKKEKEDTQKESKQYSLSIVMVGDALIHWGVYNDAKQSDNSYDFKPMLSTVKPIISKYDLAYYNQETILGGSSLNYSSYPRFNSPQEVGDAFIDAGFNMVSLATNHTMDKGEIGVLNSNEYWKNKENIAYSGSWASEEERENSIIKVYEKNNIKYGFISYTIWTNGLETPTGKEYLNNVYSEEKARDDIQKIRDKVDFLIVAMHWGTEYSFNVDYKQEQIANFLSNEGVDLIIGSHPHVVQTVEYINNNKTLVIYSLGNFISDQNDVDNFTGLMMEATLNKKIDENNNIVLSIDNPKAELVYTTTKRINGINHEFRIIPYPLLNNEQLPNYLNYYDKYKNIVTERYENLTWGLSGE